MQDETTNAASPKAVKKATKRAKRGQAREIDDLKFLLRHEEGRRFIWKYLERCGIFTLSFDKDNSHKSSFNEGERNIGLKLLSEVTEASPDAFLVMMNEARGN